MELVIEGISHNGEGVARYKGKVIFIPRAIPGETVKVDIVEEKKKYSRAVLRKVIKPSPDRTQAKCPYYNRCGGCSYQHISYKQQLLLKKDITREAVNRIGKIEAMVLDTIGMQEPWNYRNKVLWHLNDRPDGKKMGFYHYRSKQLIEIDHCPLLLSTLNQRSVLIKEMLQGIHLEENSAVMLRQSKDSHQVILEFINCFADNKIVNKLSQEIDTIYEKRHGKTRLLAGKGVIKEKAGKCYFIVGADDFFQINPTQSELMIHVVTEYLKITKQNKVLDAYCGTGMFALNVADKVLSVLGIDANASAIKNARKNAELNGIKNCQFISGLCESILPNLKNNFDRVIIDPPRAGLKPEVINALIGNSAELMVYVSCNPATLSRDLKQFILNKYKVLTVQPIDVFPQTGHIENIVTLQRV